MAKKNYSEEFRRDAVELYRDTGGATVAGIAADLGVSHGSLTTWLRNAGIPIRRPAATARLVVAAGDREGVELAADQHRGTSYAAVIDDRDAMPTQPRDDRIGPGAAEESDDALCRFPLLARNLGVSVQVMTKRHEIAQVAVGQGHQSAISTCRLAGRAQQINTSPGLGGTSGRTG